MGRMGRMGRMRRIGRMGLKGWGGWGGGSGRSGREGCVVLFQVGAVEGGEWASDVAEDSELEAADFGFPEGFGGEEGRDSL